MNHAPGGFSLVMARLRRTFPRAGELLLLARTARVLLLARGAGVLLARDAAVLLARDAPVLLARAAGVLLARGAPVLLLTHGALVLLLALGAPVAAEEFPDLIEPPVVASRDGILAVTLTAASRDLPLGPVTIPAMIFNDVYAGPTLVAHPGDRMLIRLVNDLTEPTNLHFHGIQTSPLGNSDNIHLAAAPGDRLLYSVLIPVTQPPGTYWYHAHMHGNVEHQVMAGLSGTIIVQGFAQQFRALDGITEHLLVFKEYEFDDSDDGFIDGVLHERLQTINGQTGVEIRMRPHETQLWHLTNQASNQPFNISLRGHRFRIIGEDGVARNDEVTTEVLHLNPAARMEVLVDAGDAGISDLVSENTMTGTEHFRVLGHLAVAGEPAVPVAALEHFPERDDLRRAAVDTRLTMVFTEDAENEKFFLDGRLYDHDRIDLRVPLGSIQEWTIRNDTPDFHEFHIHQLHFQVVAVNGEAVPFDGYHDIVRVPEQGSVTIRLAFTRREIVGTFVYHCHVLKHEDKGMMANIEVYDPAAPRRGMLAPFNSWLTRLVNRGLDLPYAMCGG